MNKNTLTLPCLFLAITLLTCVSILSGQANEFPSQAKEEYYADIKYKPFKPVPKSRIKKIRYPNINLLHFQETNNPFTNVWEMSVQQKISDSIWFYANQEASIYKDDPKLYTDALMSKMDSIVALDKYKAIAGIEISQIIRIDSSGRRQAIIYSYSKYQEYMHFGYWVALSEDNGCNWNYYYLGLIENQFIHLKGRQNIPLFFDEKTLQIECAIVRKTSPMILPTTPPEYELVEDNIIAKIDLEGIIRDMDNDGLTDLEEKRMLLDANNPDTDEDGIPDGVDSNPRNASVTNKFTSLYSYLVEPPMAVSMMDSIIPFIPNKTAKPYKGFTKLDSTLYSDPTEREMLIVADSLYRSSQVNIITTNDEHLFHLPRTLGCFIIITEKEYNILKTSVFPPIENLSITPMFPVDDMPDHYIIKVSGPFWSNDYLVIEKEDHWIVRIIGMMIV